MVVWHDHFNTESKTDDVFQHHVDICTYNNYYIIICPSQSLPLASHAFEIIALGSDLARFYTCIHLPGYKTVATGSCGGKTLSLFV